MACEEAEQPKYLDQAIQVDLLERGVTRGVELLKKVWSQSQDLSEDLIQVVGLADDLHNVLGADLVEILACPELDRRIGTVERELAEERLSNQLAQSLLGEEETVAVHHLHVLVKAECIFVNTRVIAKDSFLQDVRD